MAITSTSEAQYAVGSLVRTRGRDWVVLPSEDPDVLRLRPLTGSEEQAIGLFLPLERHLVSDARFELPDPALAGDATGGLLLRDAARLNIRNGAAPFRSLGRVSVVPRPYQFVPLIMALRLDPVRLLIADDVGVGKTIEAAMIARELLDRGLAHRLAVICPAHLCEQWQAELREKFSIDAALVQPATIGRLERELPRRDISIYQWYPHLVVSIDFIKSERHRGSFLDNAPDLVIADEVHMAARPAGQVGRAQHQRYELVHKLADDPMRNLLLVSATPHSGIEESFRSVLGLLNHEFDVDEQGEPSDIDRKRLVPFVVQRRRSDLEHWLGSTTPFPERRSDERAYNLSADYHALFNDVLAYCRELIQTVAGLRGQQQRVRHWAATALLRCVLSSPDAAAAVLAGRARREGHELLFESEEEIDLTYRPQVLDPVEQGESSDYVPSAPLEDAELDLSENEKRRLARFLKQARGLAGPKNDAKLDEAGQAVGELLREGFRPIVFCRFIATAKYLKEWLPKLLAKDFPDLQVSAVTGEIGDEQRREEVSILTHHPTRVLVATDCLSEGINLQEHFDAVVHYDLPWNPNRLEQREGRVDRFGQQRPEVRTTVLYGADNQVDLVVLDVLIRKARTIRRRLGISVPVPVESDQVMQAVVDSVLLRSPGRAAQLQLGLTDPEVSRLHREWERAADKERQQRAFFAQHGIQPDEVARELEATDPVLGDATTVRRFLSNAAQRLGGELRPTKKDGVFELQPGPEMSRVLRERGSLNGHASDAHLRVAFDPLVDERATYLTRTHDVIASYCDTILGNALGPDPDPRFARCGAIYTDAVQLRTGVVLLRTRYLLRDQADEFAEEVLIAAFQRQAGKPVWIEPWESAGRDLLERAQPITNMPQDERERQVGWALDLLQTDSTWFEPLIEWRKQGLQESNNRLRKLVKAGRLVIRPHTPPDILGCYVLVPGGSR